MVSCGVISLLVRHLNENKVATSERESLIGTIGNIACFEGHEFHVIASGALPCLVRILLEGDTDRILELTAGALGNTATCYQSRQLLVEAGAVVPLVRLLRSPTQVVRENATWAISTLVTAPSPHTAIQELYECKAIPLLIENLSTGSPISKTYTLQILCHMTHSYVYREDVIEAGVIPVAVESLLSPGVNTKSAAAALISNMTWSQHTRQLLMRYQYPAELEEGRGCGDGLVVNLLAIIREGVQAITSMQTSSSTDSKTLNRHVIAARHAAQAICNITMTDSYREIIVLVDGLDVLTACLGVPATDSAVDHMVCGLRVIAVNALSNIARSFHLMKSLFDCGAAAEVVNLLKISCEYFSHLDHPQTGPSCAAVVEVCVVAIGHLAFTDDLRMALWEMDVLTPLVMIVECALDMTRNMMESDTPQKKSLLVQCEHHNTQHTLSPIGQGSEEKVPHIGSSDAARIARILEGALTSLAHLSFLPASRVDLYHMAGSPHEISDTDEHSTASRIVRLLVHVMQLDKFQHTESGMVSVSAKCRESCCVLLGNLGTLPSLQEDYTSCKHIIIALRHVINSHNQSSDPISTLWGAVWSTSYSSPMNCSDGSIGHSTVDYDAAIAALALFEVVAPPCSPGHDYSSSTRYHSVALVEAWRAWLWQKLGYSFPSP